MKQVTLKILTLGLFGVALNITACGKNFEAISDVSASLQSEIDSNITAEKLLSQAYYLETSEIKQETVNAASAMTDQQIVDQFVERLSKVIQSMKSIDSSLLPAEHAERLAKNIEHAEILLQLATEDSQKGEEFRTRLIENHKLALKLIAENDTPEKKREYRTRACRIIDSLVLKNEFPNEKMREALLRDQKEHCQN